MNPCLKCGAECSVQVIDAPNVEATIWICSQHPWLGGKCTSTLAYLSEEAWNDQPSHEQSFADIPDADLLGRAVRGCRARQSGKSPRWVAVSDTFALGSTYSAQLCRRFGLDPEEMIGRRQ